MKAETMKILDPKIKVTATCVRVPTFVGHAEALNIEFSEELSADDARDINTLNMWCVSDNLRKGAALNAIQVAEALVNRGFKSKAAA